MGRFAGARHAWCERKVIGTVAIAVLLWGGVLQPAATAPRDEAERRAICAEAEARYRAVTGRASTDEPVAVILMYKDTFCPAHLTIKQGARLRWVNVDRRTSHSVWFRAAGKPESERAFAEETIEFTVDLPVGDHPYLCGPHWEREGMVGRLTVTEK